MGKELLRESRRGFAGGLNTVKPPDGLAANELFYAYNARVVERIGPGFSIVQGDPGLTGGVTIRPGTRKLHPTVLESGATVNGVYQWTNQSGNLEVVAICNGKLHHKTTAWGDFTTVSSPTGFSTTEPTIFQPMRTTSAAGKVVLYMASGGKYFSWNGTTLTDLTGSDENFSLIAQYHTRMFGVRADELKKLVWGVVGDATDFTVSGPTDGGEALVSTVSGETITSINTVGGSLLIFTEDAIHRFTGYSSDDIQLAQDTEGVSSQIGLVNPQAIAVAGTVAFIITDRGPYAVSEAGVQDLGEKIFNVFVRARRDYISRWLVGYNRSMGEIWFVMGDEASADVDDIYVYNIRLDCWYGPWVIGGGTGSEMYCISRYEDSTGAEYLMGGFDDGFVRHLESGITLNSAAADGSGGSTLLAYAEPAPFFFETGPGMEKALEQLVVHGDFRVDGSVDSQVWIVDNNTDAWTAYDITGATPAVGGTTRQFVRPYRVDVGGNGGRFKMRFVLKAQASIPSTLVGVDAYAYDMQRRTF